MASATSTARASSARWALLRDALVFQGKLFCDGARDLLLSPLAIGALLVDLVAGGERPGQRFYSLLRAGRRSERWINLFGAAEPKPPAGRLVSDSGASGVDAMVTRLEEVVVDQYQRGGITASAKDAIDRWLDAIERRPPSR